MVEPRLSRLLCCYAVASFTYSYLCGRIGATYNPLAAYQTYSIAYMVWFLIGCAIVRPKRLWPPTWNESLSAFSSVVILTAETLALMLPGSLISVVASKGGCLLLPDKTDTRPFWQRMGLALLTVLSILLAGLGKPLRVAAIPFGLALLYIAGYAIKLPSCRVAKDDPTAKSGYISAGQMVVLLLCLSLSSIFNRFEPGATLWDGRLWLIALASLLCGLIGTRMLVHRARQGIVFPAYRALSLVCALMAGYARGEYLRWNGWVATLIALFVVWSAARKSPPAEPSQLSLFPIRA